AVRGVRPLLVAGKAERPRFTANVALCLLLELYKRPNKPSRLSFLVLHSSGRILQAPTQHQHTMMKTAAALVALLSASASAFAPAQQSARSSVSLNAERSKSLPFMNRPPLLDGSMAGDVGFDPLGLSDIEGVGVDLYWLREAEIKHCRVAMLAVAGVLQVELFGPAPGNEMCTAKNQMEAFWQFWNAHPQYIAAAFIMIMMIEAVSGIATTSGRESGERAPGDFGLDPLGFMKGDPAKAERLKAQEVANGRLAMWAAAGMIVQGMTTGESATENLMSALRDNSF
ncbi:MAG: hypothetical protein SGILL_008050, partial [Bacillariaceae sp.]